MAGVLAGLPEVLAEAERAAGAFAAMAGGGVRLDEQTVALARERARAAAGGPWGFGSSRWRCLEIFPPSSALLGVRVGD